MARKGTLVREPLRKNVTRISPSQYFGDDIAFFLVPRGVVEYRTRDRPDGTTETVDETIRYTFFNYLIGKIREKIIDENGEAHAAWKRFISEFNTKSLLRHDLLARREPQIWKQRMTEDGFIENWREANVDNPNDAVVMPPNPIELYEKIKGKLLEYIDFTEKGMADVLTLWIIGTYLYSVFPSFPYIYLMGSKRSGKTKVLAFAEGLAYNAMFTMNISSASLFRLVEDLGTTLLIDESEQLNNPERRAEFRALLLQGYKQGGEVVRVEGDVNKTVTSFLVYSPKMLGNIGGIEDVLEDRTVPFIMQRSKDLVISNKWPPENGWPHIRDELYAFALEYYQEIRAVFGELNPPSANGRTVIGREWELWHPLFALGAFIFKDKPAEKAELIQTLTRIIFSKIEEKKSNALESNTDYIIALYLLQKIEQSAFVTPKDLANELKGDFPWLGKPHKIWRSLRRIGLRVKKRTGNIAHYWADLDTIRDYCERHELEEPDEPIVQSEPKSGSLESYGELEVEQVCPDGLTREIFKQVKKDE